jgi:hypothetical protein
MISHGKDQFITVVMVREFCLGDCGGEQVVLYLHCVQGEGFNE